MASDIGSLCTVLGEQLSNGDELDLGAETKERRSIQLLCHVLSLKWQLESHTFQRTIEDTFCHGAIDALLTHRFPRKGRFHLDWANKESDGSKERRQNGYKPDGIISRDGCEIAFMEVKPPKETGSGRSYLDDQWKLANFCKDTIDSFLRQGRLITQAAAVQIFGHKISLYTMEYNYLDTIDTTAEIRTPPVIENDNEEDRTAVDEGRPSKITPTSRANMF
ncbi:hypothetical protein EC957_001850 [Mortierella hygrophila]|uniref:Uncharacterized protein n=1 Tax=Mortierella hygrophila TaxID=979708 RepID=A0A9P6F5N5_9FUNG|nr:hypothetical protein EC957_001850 [Mortierella hygrophila]